MKCHHEKRKAASSINAQDEGYGFSVRGDAPVVVAGVEQNSLADVRSRLITTNSTWIILIFTRKTFSSSCCWWPMCACVLSAMLTKGHVCVRSHAMQNSACPEYVDKVGRCVRNAPQCCWRPLCAVCVPSPPS